MDPRNGARFCLDQDVTMKHDSKVVFLDEVAGVSGMAVSDVVLVAFSGAQLAGNFLKDINSHVTGKVFLTSTRQGTGVFLAEVVLPVQSWTSRDVIGVELEYLPASYEARCELISEGIRYV